MIDPATFAVYTFAASAGLWIGAAGGPSGLDRYDAAVVVGLSTAIAVFVTGAYAIASAALAGGGAA